MFRSKKTQKRTAKVTRKALAKVLTKRSPKVSSTVKSYVKRTLSKALETKIAPPTVQNGAALAAYGLGTNPNIPTLIDLTGPLSLITQGTGEGNRIGNRIQTVNMNIKGFISIPAASVGNDQYVSSGPRYLKMIIFKQRKTNAIPTNMSDLFQNGNSSVAPQNLPQDMYAPFNNAVYQIFDKRMFKLGRASKTTDAAPINLNNNNDFSLSKYFRINLTKHVPKSIRYDDATAAPENVGLYAAFLMCTADGTAITSTAYPEFAFSCVINYTYKDS